MSDRHVIVGAGPVGAHTARLLAAQGSQVVVVTRSGRSPGIDGVESVALDASDPARLSEVAEGATALYNCANPSAYTNKAWSQIWPPLAASLLTAAERSGAVLVVASNLYPYGPVDVPMVEGMPDAATDAKGVIRARMWAEALRAHEEGRIKAVEVRASVYVGSGVGAGGHVSRVIPAALEGKPVRMLGDLDQPHSWTDVLDVARTLIKVATTESAWGRVWHAPTNAPRTQREAVGDVLAAAGRPMVKIGSIPGPVMTIGAAFVPMIKALHDTNYQRTRPYILDSTAAQTELSLAPTPWDEVCTRTAQPSVR